MIELMIEAERALGIGLLDQAERLYGQVVAADPRNSIAIVGLARVALERGHERVAFVEARRALAIDPENPMASHLVMRMSEILRARGESLPAPEPSSAVAAGPTNAAASGAAGGRPGLVGRLFRRGGSGR
jgi:thioredoxin-like negative regulator of GroEL